MYLYMNTSYKNMEERIKKIDITKNIIINNKDLFLCPICGESLKLDIKNSIVCKNKHTFDLSKTGYVNLLLNSINSHYEKKMFESRKAICELGAFDKMILKINEVIFTYYLKYYKQEKVTILDVGCGEGSHLSNIINELEKSFLTHFQGIGIDIEKEAIKIASKKYSNIIWCVADLVKCPFKSESFDIITNIFSPSNYTQFSRLLKTNGILVKVIPGEKYLEQLRNAFYKETNKGHYSNENVIKHFEKNFNVIYKDSITYNIKLNSNELKELIQMTPLSWGIDEEKIKSILKKDINTITIDLCIIVGKK